MTVRQLREAVAALSGTAEQPANGQQGPSIIRTRQTGTRSVPVFYGWSSNTKWGLSAGAKARSSLPAAVFSLSRTAWMPPLS